MTICYICEEASSAIQGHHVVPQGSGGTEGPVVDLCASCHQIITSAAKSMKAGKSADKHLQYLSEDAKLRANGLIQIILMAMMQSPLNPNPLVAAVLKDPRYLTALKLYQRDAGFTSQEATINGILHGLALRYGLLENQSKSVEKRVKLSDFRRVDVS